MSGTSDLAALATRLVELRRLHDVRDWSHQPEGCDVCNLLAAYDALVHERDELRRLLDDTAKADELVQERDAATVRFNALVEAVEAFKAKYDELKPAMEGAFAFQQIHGLPYTGDNWGAELDAMLALARAGRGTPR